MAGRCRKSPTSCSCRPNASAMRNTKPSASCALPLKWVNARNQLSQLAPYQACDVGHLPSVQRKMCHKVDQRLHHAAEPCLRMRSCHLLGRQASDHTPKGRHGLVEPADQVGSSRGIRLRELPVTVAHKSCFSELRTNEVFQVTCQVQHQ